MQTAVVAATKTGKFLFNMTHGEGLQHAKHSFKDTYKTAKDITQKTFQLPGKFLGSLYATPPEILERKINTLISDDVFPVNIYYYITEATEDIQPIADYFLKKAVKEKNSLSSPLYTALDICFSRPANNIPHLQKILSAKLNDLQRSMQGTFAQVTEKKTVLTSL